MHVVLKIGLVMGAVGVAFGADAYAYREVQQTRWCPVTMLKASPHVHCNSWTSAYPLSAVLEGNRRDVQAGTTIVECTWTRKVSRVLNIPLSVVRGSRKCKIP